ncbi:MAG: hypothetical protein KAQ98_04900 [Bacteriovoracaceae bacterium]|nr:hypothetical protein [Bacteriovoracaceae bacterium]
MVRFSNSGNAGDKAFPLSLTGGMMIWGQASGIGDVFGMAFVNQSDTDWVELKNAEWSFYVAGWTGNYLEGTVKCGVANASLYGGIQTVNIVISDAKCGSSTFAPPDFLFENQFKPLRLITCKSLSGVSAGGNCDDGAKGASGSYRVIMSSYPISKADQMHLPLIPSVTSSCITGSSGTISGTDTGILIPTGSAGISAFGVAVKAYESEDCSGYHPFVKIFPFVKGLIHGTGDASVFAGTSYTEVFLRQPPTPEAGVAYKLNLAGPSIGPLSSCLGPYTVSVVDSISVPINVAADTAVYLTHSGTQDGLFYEDSGCISTSVTQISVTASSSEHSFYFKKTTDDSAVSLTAAASGLVDGTSTLNVTGNPTQLSMSGPGSGNVNSCIGPYTVTLLDASSSPVEVASIPVSVNLTYTATLQDGGFYWGTDSTCASTTYTQMQIAVDNSSFDFYFKKASTDSITLTATDTPDNYTDGSTGLIINP